MEQPAQEVRGGKVVFVHFGWRGGRVTAAVEVPLDKEDRRRRVAFSFCSPLDAWDRKKGNLIALGRLNVRRKDRSKAHALVDDPDADLETQLKQHLDHLLARSDPASSRRLLPWWVFGKLPEHRSPFSSKRKEASSSPAS